MRCNSDRISQPDKSIFIMPPIIWISLKFKNASWINTTQIEVLRNREWDCGFWKGHGCDLLALTGLNDWMKLCTMEQDFGLSHASNTAMSSVRFKLVHHHFWPCGITNMFFKLGGESEPLLNDVIIWPNLGLFLNHMQHHMITLNCISTNTVAALSIEKIEDRNNKRSSTHSRRCS